MCVCVCVYIRVCVCEHILYARICTEVGGFTCVYFVFLKCAARRRHWHLLNELPVYMYMYMYIYVRVYICMHKYVCGCVCVCMRTCVYI